LVWMMVVFTKVHRPSSGLTLYVPIHLCTDRLKSLRGNLCTWHNFGSGRSGPQMVVVHLSARTSQPNTMAGPALTGRSPPVRTSTSSLHHTTLHSLFLIRGIGVNAATHGSALPGRVHQKQTLLGHKVVQQSRKILIMKNGKVRDTHHCSR